MIYFGSGKKLSIPSCQQYDSDAALLSGTEIKGAASNPWEHLVPVAKEYNKSITSVLATLTHQALWSLQKSVQFYSQFQGRRQTFVKSKAILRSYLWKIYYKTA